jgi:hypothetical protein
LFAVAERCVENHNLSGGGGCGHGNGKGSEVGGRTIQTKKP